MKNLDLIKIQKINSEMEELFKQGKDLNKDKSLLLKRVVRKRLFEIMMPYTWQITSFSRGSGVAHDKADYDDDYRNKKTTLRLRIKDKDDDDNLCKSTAAIHIGKKTKRRKSISRKISFSRPKEEIFIKKMMDKSKVPSFEDLRLLMEDNLNCELKLNKDIEVFFNYNELSFAVDDEKVDNLFDLLKQTNLSINLSSLISEIDEMEAALSYRKRIISELSKNLLFNC